MGDDRPTVLVVDDEADVVDVYALGLGEECEVRTASGGREALEAVDESVDVVLLDRRMPGLSGREVLESIRERGLDVRVAMVTAVDPDLDVAEMEFDAYLTKPVHESELRDVVGKLVTLGEQDERTRERVSIAERLAVLESSKAEPELAESDEYASLRDRADELDARTAEAVGEMDAETFAKTFVDPAGGEPVAGDRD